MADCNDETTKIPREAFARVRRRVRDYCGLSYSKDSAFLLETRLSARFKQLGIRHYREYEHRLNSASGDNELDELVETLATHETYFYREEYQLTVFRDQLVPRLVDTLGARRSVSVWSAGCSTGEEVYTLATLMHEHPALREHAVHVVGSDISQKVIVHARRGVYGSSSFRNAPEHWRSRYFVPEGQQYRIRDEIREMCSFHRLNLRQTDTYPDLGRWDFIFCRNVLIYLSPEAREHILSAFFNVLAPGGYLLLGHSENLLNVDTPFESLHLNNELVYRRGADTAGRGR